jgi:DedD protein
MAARRRGGSRTGTFLVLMGIVGVLTVTFGVGVWTGHNWPVLFGEAKAPATAPSASRRPATERPRPADALPALTFYDELKAPLTAPPPPAKTAKRPRPAEAIRHEAATEAIPPADAAAPPASVSPEPTAPSTPAPAAVATPVSDGPSRFTVQVGAYNVRMPADALRSMLASAGHEARVVEAVTPSGVRYRVQVGTFVTRQAAQDAAARLGAERALQTFVTTR